MSKKFKYTNKKSQSRQSIFKKKSYDFKNIPLINFNQIITNEHFKVIKNQIFTPFSNFYSVLKLPKSYNLTKKVNIRQGKGKGKISGQIFIFKRFNSVLILKSYSNNKYIKFFLSLYRKYLLKILNSY